MIKNILSELGFRAKQHVMIHSSFKALRTLDKELKIEELISALKELISHSGSIIMPAFTYCFKSKDSSNEVFDRLNSKCKVGAISEVFRKSEGVVRTSSPTHSFALWGKVTEDIDFSNNPESPLGAGSPIEWLVNQNNSYIAMLGTDFNSFTMGHYLEIKAPVPWSDISPWDHLGITKNGVSTDGEIKLKEVPGCSKAFVNFENYLLNHKLMVRKKIDQFEYYFIPTKILYNEGLIFFKTNPGQLICPAGKCEACNERSNKLHKINW